MLHQFARGTGPTETFRLHNRIGGCELRLLAICWCVGPARIERLAAANCNLALHLLFGLCRHQPMIHAPLQHQLVMAAGFRNLAMVEDQNAVAADYARQAVRKDQRSPAFHQTVQRILDNRFVFRVDGGQRFVQHQNWRIAQNGAGDGNALALSARQADAAFADHRCITVR